MFTDGLIRPVGMMKRRPTLTWVYLGEVVMWHIVLSLLSSGAGRLSVFNHVI